MTEVGCTACDIVRGDRVPAGGVLRRGSRFVLHGLDGPTPLPGWLVLTSLRHARALYELDADELGLLGPASAAIMRAQRSVLGAEHVYAFARRHEGTELLVYANFSGEPVEIDLPDDAELVLTNAPQGPRLEAWEARVYRRGA